MLKKALKTNYSDSNNWLSKVKFFGLLSIPVLVILVHSTLYPEMAVSPRVAIHYLVGILVLLALVSIRDSWRVVSALLFIYLLGVLFKIFHMIFNSLESILLFSPVLLIIIFCPLGCWLIYRLRKKSLKKA